MPDTGTITINRCIMELEKILAENRISFQKQVTQRKMTHFTRDSRLGVMEKILELFYRAANDTTTSVPELLKQLPK